MTLVGHTARPYRFGRFLLEPGRRLLTADGAPVALSSRAFDILQLLVERRDEIVSREEIFGHVWRGTSVEGNTLAVHISALRRALGDAPGGTQLIATIPGRGYRFVGQINEGIGTQPAKLDEPAGDAAHATADVAPACGMIAADQKAEAGDLVSAATFRLHTRKLTWAGFACVLLAVCLGITVLLARHPPIAPRLSIVVMPFRNLGTDIQQDYLADAISDDLTTDLSHIPGSVVIARASADTYKGRAVAANIIGRELNVRYLLEGSVRAEGDMLHINAQLIDAPTGAHLWANAFDASRAQMGNARAEIVRHIGSALNVTLVDIEGARSLRERPENPDAVDLYLRARSVLDHSNSLESLVTAQQLLARATAIAPDFSDAFAQLALLLLHKISDFDDPDEKADYAQARLAVSIAMSQAPSNTNAIIAKGLLAWEDGDCAEAEPSFHLALSIDPNSAQARSGLARCARELGRMQQMIDEIQEIIRLDPTGSKTAARQHLIGMGYLMLGDPVQSLAWLDRSGAGMADNFGPETTLGWQEWRQIYLIAASSLAGDKARAAKAFAEYRTARPNRTIWHLSSYDTRALSKTRGYADYLAALKAVGMQPFADENQDFGVRPTATPHRGGDFDPTPLSVPGARRITTGELAGLLAQPAKLVVLDFGRGAAVPRDATWLGAWAAGGAALDEHILAAADPGGRFGRDRTIVVMGDGPFGWTSYNEALHLVAMSFRHVLWYRGGEEAWTATGHPAVDQRTP